MADLELRKFVETGLFLNVISTLNENWFEHEKWDEKTKRAVENYKKLFYTKNYFDYSLIMQEMLYQLENNLEFAKLITNQSLLYLNRKCINSVK